MGVPGSSIVGLLLLLFCLGTRLTTINAKTARTRRASSTSPRQAEYLDIQTPRKINNEILSLVENQNVTPEQSDPEETLDQRVDQSKIVAVNIDDIKDLENIEHLLSILEYEPRKINKKEKRKTMETFNNNPGTIVSNNENVNPTSDVANVYYEVPRTVQPQKIIVVPQYYPIPNEDVPKLPGTDSNLRAEETQNIYSVSTLKPIKPRFSRTRSQLNPQTTVSTDETRLTNVPNLRVTPQYKPYPTLSTLSTDRRKQKYYTDSIITTTPPSEVSYSTKASRRKKIRKRVNKDLNKQVVPSPLDGDNYPSEFPKVQATNEGSRNKSKRLSLLAKYDTISRPFSKIRSSKASLESNLEQPADGGIASDITHNFSHSSTHPNAVKNDDGSSNGYPKVVSPIKNSSSGLNRKLYHRKDFKDSSTFQVKSDPTLTDHHESSKSDINRPSLSSIQNSIKQTSGSDPYQISSKESPDVTPPYQSIKSPAVTVHLVNPVVSTLTPYLATNDYVYYPSLLSTLAPVQHLEVSTTVPWIDEPSSNRPEEENEELKVDNEEDNKRVPDGVAEATVVGHDESEQLSNRNTKYAIHEKSDEGSQAEDHDQKSHEYIHDDQQVLEDTKDDSDRYKNYGTEGYGRYAQSYDDGIEEDTLTDGSHDNESHQSAQHTGAAGGDGKFEKGTIEERKQGHQQSDGETGEKGYKSWHENEKANKGHHDKERHNNYFNEEDGQEKESKDEGGYNAEYQEGEKGEKQAEFGEDGKHQKGYNTKGQHSVHKKDEYEKRTEFFDEYNEDGDMEKDGEFYHEHKMSKGGHHKVGHHDEDDKEEMYGKKAKYEKGGHHHEGAGHKINEGKDDHYEHEEMHGGKKNHKDGKKWAYKKGDGGDGGDGGDAGGKGH